MPVDDDEVQFVDVPFLLGSAPIAPAPSAADAAGDPDVVILEFDADGHLRAVHTPDQG